MGKTGRAFELPGAVRSAVGAIADGVFSAVRPDHRATHRSFGRAHDFEGRKSQDEPGVAPKRPEPVATPAFPGAAVEDYVPSTPARRQAHGGRSEMVSTRKHPEFWILCEEHEGGSEPLTVFLPDLGKALAVFGFGEEALLYALLGGGGGDRRVTSVDAAGLSALLTGHWSRFERVALDPLPEPVAGLVNRPAGMDREDFLALLASPGRRTQAAAVALQGARP